MQGIRPLQKNNRSHGFSYFPKNFQGSSFTTKALEEQFSCHFYHLTKECVGFKNIFYGLQSFLPILSPPGNSSAAKAEGRAAIPVPHSPASGNDPHS
jgi:hypothetical protein